MLTFVKILCFAYVVKIINFLICCMLVRTSKDYFLYFAYGSNMLKKRIRSNNPSAKFVGIGKLSNYQLDFVNYSQNWRGSVATVVPAENMNVWGVVWKLNKDDQAALDKQEGVQNNEYNMRLVNVEMFNGSRMCRTYQHSTVPDNLKSYEELPLDRRPSVSYKDCIVKGAIECNLPEEYIDKLKKIPDNGQLAAPKFRDYCL